jgi:hypothetical protein
MDPEEILAVDAKQGSIDHLMAKEIHQCADFGKAHSADSGSRIKPIKA